MTLDYDKKHPRGMSSCILTGGYPGSAWSVACFRTLVQSAFLFLRFIFHLLILQYKPNEIMIHSIHKTPGKGQISARVKKNSLQKLWNKSLIPILLLLLPLQPTFGQDFNIPYVPTPSSVVNKMLDIAEVGPGDYLIDLGSGDGRIVIEAARRGAVAHGVEIDHDLVREAEEKARNANVENKVLFLEEDVFKTDFSRATVVTLYLMEIINLKLRPELLDKLNPGAKIVSHSFAMEDWKPDKHVEESGHQIYYWVVPAKIEGRWKWKTNGKHFTMLVEQQFQEISLELLANKDTLKVKDQVLKGNKLNFTAIHPDSGNKYLFHGEVKGKKITGKVQIIDKNSETIENWSAKLK
jgi:SAM-dependent methyltransferase